MRGLEKVLKLLVLLCIAIILAFIHKHVYTHRVTTQRKQRSARAEYSFPVVVNASTFLPNNRNDEATVKRSAVEKLPQVIGIGVKKCGTGALRNFLSHHPRVQMASITEPHFFDHNSTFAKGLNYYLSLMPPAKQNKLTIEITSKYLITGYVPGRIEEMYRTYSTKQPKFIAILCNPTERLFSEYVHAISFSSFPRNYLQQQMRKYASASDLAIEALRNITEKLRKDERITGNRDNPGLDDYITKHYEVSPLTNGIYVFHLLRWLSYFPSRTLLIINGNELITQPWDVMRDVQNFLGIEQVITRHNFRYDTEKGFFCIGECMGRAKGRTRSKNIGAGSPFPPLTKEVRKALNTFYLPFDEALFWLMNRTLNW